MSDIRINVKVVSTAAENAVKQLGIQTKKTEKSVSNLNVSIKQSASAFKSFAGNIAAIGVANLASGVSSLTRSFFDQTQALEDLTTQFEVLTGSAGTANQLVAELQEFSAATPFQLEDIGRATSRLISFGFSVEEAKSSLSDIGDVAAASGSNLGELSLIFGQVSAAGKLTGERLLQLQERAIPIGPAIAKTMGVAESSVRELVSQGKVDFETFEKAFQSLNDEGEFAFEGMIKRSQTLSGRISTLTDNFSLLTANIGAKFAPLFKTAVTAVTNFIQAISESKGFDQFIDNLVNQIPNAIRIVGFAFSTFTSIIATVRQVINSIRAGFNSLAATAIDAVIKINNATIALKRLVGLDTSGLEQANETLNLWKDTLVDVRSEALQANAEIEKSQNDLEQTIAESTQNVVNSYKQEVEASNEKANAVVENNKKEVDSVVEKQQKLVDLRTLFQEAEALSTMEFNAAQADMQMLANEESYTRTLEGLQEEEKLRILADVRRLQQAGKTEEAIKKIQEGAAKAKQERQKQELTEERGFYGQLQTLSQSNNKALAAIGKAGALVQIALKTEEAIGNSYAFGTRIGGPALGGVFGGIAAAAMAARAAKIAGLNFQDGGIVPGTSFTGDRVQANVNSGEMILNRQQQTQLFAQANGAPGASREIVVHTTVELDGESVARSVSRQVANGFELGEQV